MNLSKFPLKIIIYKRRNFKIAEYDNKNYSIVTSNLRKPLEQHFLVKIIKEDFEKLKIRVVCFTSNIKIEDDYYTERPSDEGTW